MKYKVTGYRNTYDDGVKEVETMPESGTHYDLTVQVDQLTAATELLNCAIGGYTVRLSPVKEKGKVDFSALLPKDE